MLAVPTTNYDSYLQRQQEIMAFVVWIVLGLTSGFVGSQLAKSKRVVPDVLIGLAGSLAGGWAFNVYGPPSMNGFHLVSHYVALTASLAVLLIYYALRRI